MTKPDKPDNLRFQYWKKGGWWRCSFWYANSNPGRRAIYPELRGIPDSTTPNRYARSGMVDTPASFKVLLFHAAPGTVLN
jgi:hypothetical protein